MMIERISGSDYKKLMYGYEMDHGLQQPGESIKVIVAKDYNELSAIACEIIEQQIFSNPNSILGLATGATPIDAYKKMQTGFAERQLSYKKVITFNLDEYIGLGVEDSGSYRAFMYNNLFNALDINLENTHIPDGKAASIEAECVRYENLLSEFGYADLQLLGLGSNGHIGFNEPGTLKSTKTHCVELEQSTRLNNSRYFNNPEDMPTHAITMGISTILKGKRILLLASGLKKAEAVRTFLSKEVTKEFPASYLWEHQDIFLLVDEEAYYGVKISSNTFK